MAKCLCRTWLAQAATSRHIVKRSQTQQEARAGLTPTWAQCCDQRVAKWSKKESLPNLLPNKWLRDTVKQKMRIQCKKCHNRNNDGQNFAITNHGLFPFSMTHTTRESQVSHTPRGTGRRYLDERLKHKLAGHVVDPDTFLHDGVLSSITCCWTDSRCNTKFGDHCTTTFGNLFATSFQVLCCASPVPPNSLSTHNLHTHTSTTHQPTAHHHHHPPAT